MQQKRTYAANVERVRDATIDADLFKDIASSAGLNPYTPKTERERATLGQLRSRVEEAIDAEQRQTGKPLSRERKGQLMQQLVDRTVMLDVWMQPDQERIAAVVSPDEREYAYVPIARIPASALEQVANVIRSISPSTQRMSTGDIAREWQDRIERMYAAHLLRLGTEEEMRRLQGR
jgi:hypothetical protein